MKEPKDIIPKKQLVILERRAKESNISVEELVRRVIRRYLYPDSVDDGWEKIQMDALWRHWDNDDDSVYDDHR